MTVRFRADKHKYESINPEDKIDWVSVTTFVSQFKTPFDAVSQSKKSAKNPKSKWYKMKPEDIQAAWAAEADRAVTLGTWYHNQREADLISFDTIERQGLDVPIIKPIIDGDLKLAPEQRLVEGIYPEHFVYLKSAGICGQSDRVEVVKDTVSVFDYKTNKKIEKESFKNWEGVSKMMLGPCSHLEDCNFNHYALQLSIYLYIILKHNPRYKPGKLELQHVIFEQAGENEYGNPIVSKDHLGDPIVKEVVSYELPYLRNEVRDMIKWLEDNRDKIIKK
jgi:hypothetical protein